MKNESGYTSFDQYVLRTPLFSVDFFKQITSGPTLSDAQLRILCSDKVFTDSISIASPSLGSAIKAWLSADESDPVRTEKIKASVLKYFARACARCTPFAMFAGCAIGQFKNQSKIQIQPNHHKRYSSLDVDLIARLTRSLVETESIRDQLSFFPNNTIFKIGSKIRYTECLFINNRRTYRLAELDSSSYLDAVLQVAEHGADIESLANAIPTEANYSERKRFIVELIENQLLHSKLEPPVSGVEPLDYLIQFLVALKGTTHLIADLQQIKSALGKLDEGVADRSLIYKEIEQALISLNINSNNKSPVNVNMVLGYHDNTLDKRIVSSVLAGIHVLNRLNSNSTSNLPDFKKNFNDRYQGKWVPLLEALDPDKKLGYGKRRFSLEVNPLVDDLDISSMPSSETRTKYHEEKTGELLKKKIAQTSDTILLADSDIENLIPDLAALPDTLSVIVEIVVVDGRQKIKLSGYGGSSAANVLTRFAYADSSMLEHIQKIIDKENQLNSKNLLVEVNHIIDSDSHRILQRPSLRSHEIPYLTNSALPRNYQVQPSDLLVTVDSSNRIRIKSKTLQKEIVPRLTTASDFSSNTLPFYHFLGDAQENLGSWGIKWPAWSEEYSFLPRIEYQDLILHDAIWNIKSADIASLREACNDDDRLMNAVKDFTSIKRLPQLVVLVEGDQELLINFKCLTSVRVLLKSVASKSIFRLSEFLFSDGGIVKNENGEIYANQFIISFYKERAN